MKPTFRDLIAANKRNSVLLVLGFIAFIALLATLLSAGVLMAFDSGLDHAAILTHAAIAGLIGAGIAILLSTLSFFSGDEFVLSVNHAKPMDKSQDPQLFNVVEEMAIAAGVPMPKVYLIHDPAPNAFATGRDPAHASVAITSGLRNKLNREELQGVIAHEMAHIRNYDIRLMLLLAVLIGAVVMLCDLFWTFLRVSMYSSSSRSNRSSSRESKGLNPVLIVVFVLGILLAILAPFLAQIIQLAVSRQREYLADSSAVELTRDPIGLANALRKIDADPLELKTANRGDAHLFISNPIKKFSDLSGSIWSSHPPTADRVQRLMNLIQAGQAQ